ncbi:ABC-3 protein [Acidothermus cellulolyticus 11B]|uniref:ABC-3 protein n=1 Tax=Acidothermus cellulolyticus (strain ATCC 43068 / DSM 8971 / 11B) TaxID=351607 RepID=A0LWQ0_ACIC1|nr:metal ABC transporter permease [Acidothermus cellulolyticus]ABK53860.1 ABC-3 protein [Acidothermus cellulolyticus 11B]
MLRYPFMIHALAAGSIVAVIAAVVGWFMVLRRQSFAGHAISLAAFPGAAGAAALGWNVTAGYFVSCFLVAGILSALGPRSQPGTPRESAIVGTVLAFILSCGYLFSALSGTLLSETTHTLFGFIFGISQAELVALAATAAALLVVLGVVGRPLLFASVDATLAQARGLPLRLLDLAFLSALAVASAEGSQITGALLVFPLLVLPAAIARDITSRPAVSLLLSIGFGLAAVWIGLVIAYATSYPSGFCVTTPVFAGFVVTRLLRRHERGRIARQVVTSP